MKMRGSLVAARAYLTYPFPADCPHKKVVLEGELIMKRVSWHFLHQMVFVFLVLTPLHLSAQDYYHQLNVRIVNNSGVEMSAYVDVGGLDNGYSSKSCFTGMNNLPDGREFTTATNRRQTSPPCPKATPTYPTRSRSHFVHQQGKILKASRYTFGILLTDKRPWSL
jgi:hypothetical protein